MAAYRWSRNRPGVSIFQSTAGRHPVRGEPASMFERRGGWPHIFHPDPAAHSVQECYDIALDCGAEQLGQRVITQVFDLVSHQTRDGRHHLDHSITQAAGGAGQLGRDVDGTAGPASQRIQSHRRRSGAMRPCGR
jgi:hypothetical protein